MAPTLIRVGLLHCRRELQETRRIARRVHGDRVLCRRSIIYINLVADLPVEYAQALRVRIFHPRGRFCRRPRPGIHRDQKLSIGLLRELERLVSPEEDRSRFRISGRNGTTGRELSGPTPLCQ